MAFQNSNMFKVVIVGDSGVGKTALVKRHLTGQFNKEFTLTNGVEVTELHFQTNKGEVVLEIWDIGMAEDMKEREVYYKNTDATMVLFDVGDIKSYKHAKGWAKEAMSKVLVLCGNKVDLPRQVKARDIHLHKELNCQYYDISAKSNYNYEKPFLYIIRKLLNDEDVYFC
jgi:GTP-binding nuclear protein Ran